VIISSSLVPLHLNVGLNLMFIGMLLYPFPLVLSQLEGRLTGHASWKFLPMLPGTFGRNVTTSFLSSNYLPLRAGKSVLSMIYCFTSLELRLP
jgi:hypothetical protein